MEVESIYNPMQSIFEDALQREQKFIYDYRDNSLYKCMFRRNSDTNQQNNNVTIYYPATEPIHEGKLLKYNGKVFLALNQETIENDIYRKSDLIETNMILNTYSNEKEISVHCYACDLSNTLPKGNDVISVLGGTLELWTEYDPTYNQIEINSVFTALGGTYRIINVYHKSGILHIFIEREMNATPTSYNLTINVDAEYKVGTAKQIPVIANRTEGGISNPTIEWSSSNTEIVEFQNNTALFKKAGKVTVAAHWLEHDVPATATITVVEPNPDRKECTISGRKEIKIGFSRTYTATFYDADGNVNTSITPVWSLELPEICKGYINIVDQTENKLRISAIDVEDILGEQFYVVLTDEKGEYQCKFKVDIKNPWV